MIGIKVGRARGVGDTVQFSSVPENYFKATGERLVDLDCNWIFDDNPFVLRNFTGVISKTVDLWNFAPMQYIWPKPPGDRVPVYQSNAEIWSLVMGVTPTLIRPRLYRHEGFPFEKREKILLHVDGKSHGGLPIQIINHLIEKYEPTGQLFLIGKSELDFGLRRIETETLWDLAKVISEARMLIGCDSGPSWIAACYPDVIIKKVRCRPAAYRFSDWVPLETKNVHSHWDDRIFQIFNPTEVDVGPFQSYLRM